MYFSRTILLLLVCFQYLQFKVCQSNAEAKFSSLVSNGRSSKVQRFKMDHHLQKVDEAPCRGSKKLCLQSQLKKIQHQRKKQSNSKDKKKEKKCCKRKDKSCKRKLRKRCHLNTKCLIKQSRICRKKFQKCSNRKSTNRRPGNCRTASQTSINLDREMYKPAQLPTTTTKPMILKKKETEECNHSNECDIGLCCARHHRVKRCKPLIKEGQVCTRDFSNPQKRSPEMFERCPCQTGLSCSASKQSRHYTCQIVT